MKKEGKENEGLTGIASSSIAEKFQQNEVEANNGILSGLLGTKSIAGALHYIIVADVSGKTKSFSTS